jgi:hypothetical protein
MFLALAVRTPQQEVKVQPLIDSPPLHRQSVGAIVGKRRILHEVYMGEPDLEIPHLWR